MTSSTNQYELSTSLGPQKRFPFPIGKGGIETHGPPSRKEETFVALYLATRIYHQRPGATISNIHLHFFRRVRLTNLRSFRPNNTSSHLIMDILATPFTTHQRISLYNFTIFSQTKISIFYKRQEKDGDNIKHIIDEDYPYPKLRYLCFQELSLLSNKLTRGSQVALI